MAAPGADPAPVADEECPAEQVRPDFQATEACFTTVRPDADEGGPVGKHRELQWLGHLGAFRACGRGSSGSVSRGADSESRHGRSRRRKSGVFGRCRGAARRGWRQFFPGHGHTPLGHRPPIQHDAHAVLDRARIRHRQVSHAPGQTALVHGPRLIAHRDAVRTGRGRRHHEGQSRPRPGSARDWCGKRVAWPGSSRCGEHERIVFPLGRRPPR